MNYKNLRKVLSKTGNKKLEKQILELFTGSSSKFKDFLDWIGEIERIVNVIATDEKCFFVGCKNGLMLTFVLENVIE